MRFLSPPCWRCTSVSLAWIAPRATLAAALPLLILSACRQPRNVPMLCYRAEAEMVPDATPDLTTQFGTERSVRIGGSVELVCEPVHKRHEREQLPQDPPDQLPLTCYPIRGEPLDEEIALEDQFTEVSPSLVRDPVWLCDPVTSKRIGDERQPGDKYPTPMKVYRLRPHFLDQPVGVFTRDEFGVQSVAASHLHYLMEPALKSASGTLPDLKPLTCYLLAELGEEKDIEVVFDDQFFSEQQVRILDPWVLCDPAEKY